MSQKPPPAHEPLSYQQAEGLINRLWAVTQEILPKSTGEDLPTLNQLIMQRGRLIEECRAIPMQNFESAQQKQLQERMDQCKSLDTQIEKNMRGFQATIDKQLKHLQQSKQLLGKYQPGELDNPETHSKDA